MNTIVWYTNSAIQYSTTVEKTINAMSSVWSIDKLVANIQMQINQPVHYQMVRLVVLNMVANQKINDLGMDFYETVR